MRWIPCLFLILTLYAAPAAATPPDDDLADRIVFSVGGYNGMDETKDQRRTEIRAEWRIPGIPVWKTHPWLGVELVSDSASWVGGGLESDINLISDWLILTLQTGVGYFDDGHARERNPGKSYNPDSGIQFRHQVELAIRFPAGNRVAAWFSHMSNAHIGGAENPGIESFGVNIQIPVDFTAGRRSRPAGARGFAARGFED